jgi:hypothetical protein
VADEFPAGLVDFVAGSQIASYQMPRKSAGAAWPWSTGPMTSGWTVFNVRPAG